MAVEAKDRRNGYDHFLTNGIAEKRAPTEAIDLRHYLATNPVVRRDLDNGRAQNAFVHFLTIGRDQGLAAVLQPDQQANESQAAALNRRRAESLLPRAARTPLDFSCAGEPDVSVILLLRNRFPSTLMTLGSLRASHAGAIELILIDAGSTDDTRRIDRFVHGGRVLRFETELDFVHAGNAALNCVTADAVLFLDNAVELAPGALAAALKRLHSDPRIGAVGGKLVRAHGRLEAAGNIVWRDGTTQNYLRDASPAAPEANFVRDVDCCSATFLLLRAKLLRRLEGFDETFAAIGGADVDLCLRIVEAGSRIVYDPGVVVTKLTEMVTERQSDDARQALSVRHIDQLSAHHVAGNAQQVFARSADTARRVLFIDDMIPLRQMGSGFACSNDLIQTMASLGYRITVYPIKPTRFDLATIYAEMPDTVEVMHDRTPDELAGFLAARQGYYDTIWIARTHNLDLIRPMLEDLAEGAGKPPRIVLDTEAIASLRAAGLATLTGGPPVDVDAACTLEFANAHLCHSIIAVNSQEAQRLSGLGFPDVAVIGHWRDAQPTPRAFAERVGMLFVGAMHQQDSPNRDSLDWFVRDVLPLVEQSLGWETRLTIADYLDPAVSLEEYPRPSARHAARSDGRHRSALQRASYFRRTYPLRGGRSLQGARGSVLRTAGGGERVVGPATGLARRTRAACDGHRGSCGIRAADRRAAP